MLATFTRLREHTQDAFWHKVVAEYLEQARWQERLQEASCRIPKHYNAVTHMIRDFFSSTLDVLHKTLDLRQQRHTVLTSNIANAETPGFIAKDVRFEEALRAAATPPQPVTATADPPRALAPRTSDQHPQRTGHIDSDTV